MTQFTTINDVVNYLMSLDPGFTAELTDEQMREIVRDNRTNRYEEITQDEIDTMYNAAMAACGAMV